MYFREQPPQRTSLIRRLLSKNTLDTPAYIVTNLQILKLSYLELVEQIFGKGGSSTKSLAQSRIFLSYLQGFRKRQNDNLDFLSLQLVRASK